MCLETNYSNTLSRQLRQGLCAVPTLPRSDRRRDSERAMQQPSHALHTYQARISEWGWTGLRGAPATPQRPRWEPHYKRSTDTRVQHSRNCRSMAAHSRHPLSHTPLIQVNTQPLPVAWDTLSFLTVWFGASSYKLNPNNNTAPLRTICCRRSLAQAHFPTPWTPTPKNTTPPPAPPPSHTHSIAENTKCILSHRRRHRCVLQHSQGSRAGQLQEVPHGRHLAIHEQAPHKGLTVRDVGRALLLGDWHSQVDGGEDGARIAQGRLQLQRHTS